jgi:hypothetical protein
MYIKLCLSCNVKKTKTGIFLIVFMDVLYHVHAYTVYRFFPFALHESGTSFIRSWVN